MGDIEYEFSLILSTKILLVAVLESFWVLNEKFTVWDEWCVLNNNFNSLFGCFEIVYICYHELRTQILDYIDVLR
jgi:hypothetical protein